MCKSLNNIYDNSKDSQWANQITSYKAKYSLPPSEKVGWTKQAENSRPDSMFICYQDRYKTVKTANMHRSCTVI